MDNAKVECRIMSWVQKINTEKMLKRDREGDRDIWVEISSNNETYMISRDTERKIIGKFREFQRISESPEIFTEA